MLDRAQDCVDLATLFTKRANDVRGKTPVTAAQVERAATVGSQLLRMITPRRQRASAANANPTLRDAIAIRDRLYTLLVQRHEVLWGVGMMLFGRAEGRKLVPYLKRGEADGAGARGGVGER